MSSKAKFLKKLNELSPKVLATTGLVATGGTPQEAEAGVSKELLEAAAKALNRTSRADLFTKAHIGQIAPTGLTRDQYKEIMLQQILKENEDIAKAVKKGDKQEAHNLLINKLNLDPSDFELSSNLDFLNKSIHDSSFLEELRKRNPTKSQEALEKDLFLLKLRAAEGRAGFYNPENKKVTVFKSIGNPTNTELTTLAHEASHLLDGSFPEKTLYTETLNPAIDLPFLPKNKEMRNSFLKTLNAHSIPESFKTVSKEHSQLLPHILEKMNPEQATKLSKAVQKSLPDSEKFNFRSFLDQYANEAQNYFPDMGSDEIRSIGHSTIFPEGIERTLVKNNIVDQIPILNQLAIPKTAGRVAAGATGVSMLLGNNSDAQASTQEPKESETSKYLWKALDSIGIPQRKAMDLAASTLGVKGNPDNSEESAQAIVENLASRAGIPEDSTIGNAAKALGVAGLETFADPVDLLGIGIGTKVTKNSKRLWKAITKH